MTRKRQFYATCVGYPSLKELERIIDKSRVISKKTFLARAEVPKQIRKEMRQFPHDYEFFKSKHRKKPVYYYTWSAIEHIYK